MPKRSAGVLLFRRVGRETEVLLAHPGGPFWKNKDDGAWSIPKGEYGDDEDPLAAAKREFAEETGRTLSGDFIPLGEVRQPGGKMVSAWAVEGDFDTSNSCAATLSPCRGLRVRGNRRNSRKSIALNGFPWKSRAGRS